MGTPRPSFLPIGSGRDDGSHGRGYQPQWVSDVDGNLIDLPGRLLCLRARILGPLVSHYCENGGIVSRKWTMTGLEADKISDAHGSVAGLPPAFPRTSTAACPLRGWWCPKIGQIRRIHAVGNGERTRPRMPFSAPSRETGGASTAHRLMTGASPVPTGEGARRNTRGRVCSPKRTA